jgi:hypothetical protein
MRVSQKRLKQIIKEELESAPAAASAPPSFRQGDVWAFRQLAIIVVKADEGNLILQIVETRSERGGARSMKTSAEKFSNMMDGRGSYLGNTLDA